MISLVALVRSLLTCEIGWLGKEINIVTEKAVYPTMNCQHG